MNHHNNLKTGAEFAAVQGSIRGYAAELAQQRTQPAGDMSEVGTALSRLGQQVDELDSALGALSARLGPVLSPHILGKAIGGEVGSPAPVRSPLANGIHGQADRVFEAAVSIRGLLEALEI